MKRIDSLIKLCLVAFISIFCWNCNELNEKEKGWRNTAIIDSTFQASTIISETLLDNCKLNAIFYIEGDYCGICQAKQLFPIISYLEDSIGFDKPVLICHPYTPDPEMGDMYREYFDNECRFFFAVEDSIREKNKWMNPKINYYGFITGPSNELLYAGFLYDKHFLSMAKILFNKRKNS